MMLAGKMKTIGEMVLAFVVVASLILVVFGFGALVVILVNHWIGLSVHSSGSTVFETTVLCILGAALFIVVGIVSRIFHVLFRILHHLLGI